MGVSCFNGGGGGGKGALFFRSGLGFIFKEGRCPQGGIGFGGGEGGVSKNIVRSVGHPPLPHHYGKP